MRRRCQLLESHTPVKTPLITEQTLTIIVHVLVSCTTLMALHNDAKCEKHDFFFSFEHNLAIMKGAIYISQSSFNKALGTVS